MAACEMFIRKDKNAVVGDVVTIQLGEDVMDTLLQTYKLEECEKKILNGFKDMWKGLHDEGKLQAHCAKVGLAIDVKWNQPKPEPKVTRVARPMTAAEMMAELLGRLKAGKLSDEEEEQMQSILAQVK